MTDIILHCDQVTKSYMEAGRELKILSNVNFKIAQGERIAIVGASGSGKSTLLHILGGLDQPSSGVITLCGQNLDSLSEAERGKLRNYKLGFVYQFHHLLFEFSAIENVAMPLYIRGIPLDEAHQLASKVLASVGLGDRMHHMPSQLSGGERQRVAIGRALVTNPACVLADEPTGNLDGATASQIFALMLDLSQNLKTAFVIVTHDLALAKQCDHVFRLTENGLLSA